jgi:hypothetical protein
MGPILADEEGIEGVEFAALLLHVHSLAEEPAMFWLVLADEEALPFILDVDEAAHPLIERTEGLVSGEAGAYEQRELGEPDGVMWLAYTSSPRSDGRHVVLMVVSPAEASVPSTVIREMLHSVGPCPTPPPEPSCVPEERLAALGRGLQELRQGHEAEIKALRDRIADLEATVADLRLTRELRIGVVDAEAIFTRVFLPQVQAERAAMDAKSQEIHDLHSDYSTGRMSLEAFQQRNLELQAEFIQASLHVILTMLDKMIALPGFVTLRSDLQILWIEAQAVEDAVESAVAEVQATVQDIAAFTEWLQEIQAAFLRLDELVTVVAATKIVEVTQQVAQAQGYDLVLRTKDVVIYRAQAVVVDLSSEVERVLWALFRSE